MQEQMPLHHILRVWATSANATVAARRLGLSRRTLYDHIEKVSLAELRYGCAKLQAEAETQLAAVQNEAAQSLLLAEGRLADLTRQMDALRQEREAIEHERSILARENDALRAEVQRLTWQRPGQTLRRGDNDDPSMVLHVSRKDSPEVIEAAYRALAKLYDPDMGGLKPPCHARCSPQADFTAERACQIRRRHPYDGKPALGCQIIIANTEEGCEAAISGHPTDVWYQGNH